MQQTSSLSQNLSQSRILFEQVVVDNQPTQQQVIERAEQLQIDDLLLARQSLTKQLQSYWRPYINRYGDVYYINLKQQRAYVDHPVDMDTKILYAKRYKTKIPKFKSYQLNDVVGTMSLIQEETFKWRRGEFSFTRESIPSKLNIVYQQSDESQTEREKQSQYSQLSQPQKMQQLKQDQQDEEYIENLQHTARLQRQGMIPKVIQINDAPKIFNKEHKKFPTIDSVSSEDDEYSNKQQQQIKKIYQKQQLQLTPQYERLLIEYEQQLRKQHSEELKKYRQQKQQNFVKKQKILKQIVKQKQQQFKFNIIKEFDRQTQEKNEVKYQKDLLKVKNQFTQKVNNYQAKLFKERQIIQKLQEIHEQKRNFIQSLEHRLQSRLIQQKVIKSEELKKSIYENFYLNSIQQISVKQKQKFEKAAFKIINQNIDQKLRQRGVYEPMKNKIIYPESLSSLYESMVKKQLKNIDKLLVQNQVNRQMRKKRQSIFSVKNKSNQIKNVGKNLYVSDKFQKQRIQEEQKQNDPNKLNHFQQKKQIVKQIQKDIKKSQQNRIAFRQRRNKIFSLSKTKLQPPKAHDQQIQLKEPLNSEREKQQYSKEIKKQLWQKQNYLHKINLIKPDKKSMYLRMMKRIL